MNVWFEKLRELRFYILVGMVNLLSVGMLLYYNNPPVASSSRSVTIPSVRKEIKQEAVSGRPVSMKIPSLNVELKIDEGYYNQADASWTLSGYNAHFAMPTMPANNQEGNTLVYGHNNKHVFMPLKNLQPGAQLEIKTDNGHLFYYTFETAKSVQPDDLEIFTYEGPPIVTLQTCTGNWDELRTLSTFKLTRVIKYNPNAEQDRVYREKLMGALNDLSKPSYPKSETIQ